MDTRKSLPRNEQETIISRTRNDDAWHIYSCDETMKRKMTRIAQANGKKLTKPDQWGLELTLPLSCVRITQPIRLSEQERQARAERARQNLRKPTHTRPTS